jgi:hypothetical protein
VLISMLINFLTDSKSVKVSFILFCLPEFCLFLFAEKTRSSSSSCYHKMIRTTGRNKKEYNVCQLDDNACWHHRTIQERTSRRAVFSMDGEINWMITLTCNNIKLLEKFPFSSRRPLR